MNRKLQLVIIFYILCLPCFYAQAQSGYIEEGIWSNVDPASGLTSDFIIDNSGKKIFGEIIRSYDHSDYDNLDFESGGNVKTYFPNDLEAFGLENGRFYLSRILSDSSNVDNEFVQILFSGKLQLFSRKENYYIYNGLETIRLNSFYQNISSPGMAKTRHVRMYVSNLKVLTAGKCGAGLTDMIERSRISEQDFIRILTQYHECEDLPYNLHIAKIPFVKFSPTLAFGIGTDLTSSPGITEEWNYSFSNSLSYKVSAGFRLHDFRRFPRSSFEVRATYISNSSIFNSSFELERNLITATEDFSEVKIMIPLSYNFSFFKSGSKDFYVGLIASPTFSFLESKSAIVDQNNLLHDYETSLVEGEFIEIKTQTLVPGVKVGGNLPISSKMDFFAEIQADYFNDNYAVRIWPLETLFINKTYLSIQVGIAF